ncbi:hypothetical protein ORV05_26145 [Amycolatopsis cynarae]|uniref:Secreted protein n=1 Tax=Amycolatopsis cynarae TaxID=2995223 RepID=A0ABY7AWP5_9PSEU|nr:hypothetical protein [Amycolatopsis sp. HUAS 11-8]WAL64429.1 hypothetical protein ORV05_26145 [Amycolatopsis sp. HUAS 11-8]
MRKASRLAVAGAALCLVVVPAPAWAAADPAAGSASAGAADITVDGQRAFVDPTAPCETGTAPSGQSDPVRVGTTTRFGTATSTCGLNPDGTANVKASGQRFETSVLQRYGGPLIRVRVFSAACSTTADGSSGRIELSGVTGITLPQEIPANYTMRIPGRTPGTPPVAEIVANELIAPTPPDGSLTAHALHIRLFPEGGPASGDIVLGTASCDPFGR